MPPPPHVRRAFYPLLAALAAGIFFTACSDTSGSSAGGTPVFADPYGIEMVSIPAGTFTMGSPTEEANRGNDETQHEVTLSAFNMGKHEVTQAQWQAVMGNNPSDFTGDAQRPVEKVSWYDAIAFCNKLSLEAGLEPVYSVSGITDWAGLAYDSIPTTDDAAWNAAVMDRSKSGYRLPTEAEWEYACRAGTDTAYYTGNTADGALQAAAWYNANASSTTHPVGEKTANAFGLHDMHGNVYEWCWDRYGSYSSETDPMGATSGTNRVTRGGGYSSNAVNARSAFRGDYAPPTDRSSDVGFRVARR